MHKRCFELRRIVGFVVALGTGACSLVPDYGRPDVPMAPGWNAALGKNEGAVAARLGWWRDFGSPELNRLMARGLSGSFTLQAAIARVQEARGTSDILAAPLFPSVSLVAGATNAAGLKSARSRQAAVQASYEIDFWGRNRAAAESAASLVSATAFDAEAVATTLTASIASTYFSILSLRERLALARQIAADARRTLDLIQIQRAVGTATELQVEQQKTLLSTFEAAVPALQQQIELAAHALAVLTGQAPQGFGIGAETLAGLLRPNVLVDLPPVLLTRRPDIAAAEARLISANFDIGVARAAFFPSVSLTGLVGGGAASFALPPVLLTSVGAGLLQPLFRGGQLEGQLKFTRARQIELVAAYRQTVLAAFQDVEDALSTIEQARVREEIVAGAVASAQKAADLARLQYRLGSSDYLSVLTTETALYQASDTLLQLNLIRLQGIVSLFRALGGGFVAPGVALAADVPPAAIRGGGSS